MNDSVRIEGFNHEFERQVRIDPTQILLVGFQGQRGFVLSGGIE